MGKDPSFPFYASDWLGSTKRLMMTPAQRGAYIDLLAHQWGDKTCSLEDDDEVLAVLSGLGEGWLNGGSKVLRRCFPKHPTIPDRVANPRLLELRFEREEHRRLSSEGGKKSGRVRAAKAKQQKGCGDSPNGSNTNEGDLKAPCDSLRSESEGDLNSPSSLPSPSPVSKETPNPQGGEEANGESQQKQSTPDERGFSAFWGVVPKKVGRQAAWRAFTKARKRVVQEREVDASAARHALVDAMKAFADSDTGKGEFCPHPATWLNQGRYDDDREAWVDKPADPPPQEIPDVTDPNYKYNPHG